ncbi:binding-protein-dependent transport systems inner membrane component [Xylanimonas cellulosilytica DSM 15894]|uniref:Binding-protein-dependent transport systems inner membrane component n=1 Tax=Xylanimonas cellulosilytica (strain DSM 15894 / JCM 12276 / CECT 5975 / KCTC 9989 / LMG 20990 / NBRC 107835 / XIL07) TaxID=446471 RepID=D1BWK5_XYLCX|nr:sugar ABC transporter permease [Xylanimonas cellulosilytica]ACZ31550.1 binding-protein-dependent transport systems inner membrane component [Xylanimonas cellulosilytica DSM 15894]
MSAISELRGIRGRRAQRVPTVSNLRRADGRAAAVFLAPWFLGLFVVTLFPMAASAYLSFTEYDLLTPPRWIGLGNFVELFHDDRLWQSMKVTMTYVVTGVPLQLVAALAVAIFLNQGMRGLAFYRSVLYLPSLMGGSVAIALLWRQVFGEQGLLNALLGVFGIQGMGWVSHPDTALWTIVLLHVWTFGSPMIIFLAGLRQIPEMYYEAAQLDGASRWRQFRSVTLPLLSPIIFFNLVMQVITAFQAFTQAYVVSGGTGGPSDSTLFYTLYLYQEGFTNLHMGYASAMAWLLVLIVLALTGLNFVASKFWVYYED